MQISKLIEIYEKKEVEGMKKPRQTTASMDLGFGDAMQAFVNNLVGDPIEPWRKMIEESQVMMIKNLIGERRNPLLEILESLSPNHKFDIGALLPKHEPVASSFIALGTLLK